MGNRDGDDWLRSARETFERAANEIKQTAEDLLDDDTRATKLDVLADATEALEQRVTTRARQSINALLDGASSLADSARSELAELAQDWRLTWTETPDEFGERMRAVIVDECTVDDEWAREQANRAAERLNTVRAPATPLIPVVIWSEHYNAWSLPGRYIYISRELQQTLASDDAVAFVLAHEMAHHDLGHLGAPAGKDNDDESFVSRIAKAPSVALLAAYFQTRWMRPEAELDADARALELCLDAGYERDKCLQAFDAMKKRALDLRHLESAYGLDVHPDVDPDVAWRREKWRQRFSGYPSAWERKQRLLLGLASHEDDVPEPPEEPPVEEESETPKRRKIPDPPTYL